MISNSSKYALKAVLYLALHSREDHKLMVKDIFEPINVPKAYLAKLLQELSRHNIISSTRGPKGGFYLSEGNRKQPLMRIIKIIDGPRKIASCMLSLEDCNEEQPCPLHDLIYPSRSELIKQLERRTIEDLALDLKHKKSFLPI